MKFTNTACNYFVPLQWDYRESVNPQANDKVSWQVADQIKPITNKIKQEVKNEIH